MQQRMSTGDQDNTMRPFDDWFDGFGDLPMEAALNPRKRPAAAAIENVKKRPSASLPALANADDDDDDYENLLVDDPPTKHGRNPKQNKREKLLGDITKLSRKLGHTLTRLLTASVRTKRTKFSKAILKEMSAHHVVGEDLRKEINLTQAQDTASDRELKGLASRVATWIRKANNLLTQAKGLA